MQISIEEIIREKLESIKKNGVEKHLELKGKEYQKKRAAAVQFFQKEINKEQKKGGKKEFSFIIISQKLAGIIEIEDLRWFYKKCIIYRNKKKLNTFGKIFWGALK